MTAVSTRETPAVADSVETILAEAAHAQPSRRSRLEAAAVAQSLGLARGLAYRYRERGEPVEDLIQVAYLGLVLAVRRFSPDKGARFSTFATPTILGELRRYFRDQTWAIRPPRRLQEEIPQVRQATSDLEQELGRKPTAAMIADQLGMTAEQVREAQLAGASYRLSSLEGVTPDGSPPSAARPIAGEQVCEIDELTTRMAVATLLSTLPERDAEIIRMRFYDRLSQQQIADRIGVSQMQVSRLLARILRQLRENVDDDLLDARAS